MSWLDRRGAELAKRFDVHPAQVTAWKDQLLTGAAEPFGERGRFPITLDSAFGIAAVEEAIARYGRAEIFSTDQGAQFTSAAFTGLRCKRRSPVVGCALELLRVGLLDAGCGGPVCVVLAVTPGYRAIARPFPTPELRLRRLHLAAQFCDTYRAPVRLVVVRFIRSVIG